MSFRALLLFAIGLALIMPDFAAAQIRRRAKSKSSAQSSSSGSDYDWELDEKEEKAPKKSKKRRQKSRKSRDDKDREEEPEDAPKKRPMSSKQDIEAHLQARIKTLQKFHRGQDLYGKRMSASWVKFWDKVYEDRKLFDVRMARQRLNLFESLASLDSVSHDETISDFERLQTTQIRAFELELKKQMHDYLTQMLDDLRGFTIEQEKVRDQFNRDLMESWRSQKGRSSGRRKRRDEDRRD
ncbi:MAG: hypothetical protein ABIJ96_16055 [Elusimicrobiota bacterium]